MSGKVWLLAFLLLLPQKVFAETIEIAGSSSDTASNDQTIQKADPAIIFDGLTATDTDYWIGLTSDEGGDNDDFFDIGSGTTPGSNVFARIDTSSTQYGLTLGLTGSSPSLTFSDTDVVHGVTTIASTNAFGKMSTGSGTNGGMFWTGFSDNAGAQPLMLRGVSTSDPTDTIPMVQIRTARASGTGLADLAGAEVAFQVSDSTGADDFLTVTGDGRVEIAGSTNVTGQIVSQSTDILGWSVVDGTDNTTCVSQCTHAAVFGFDGTTPVGPSSALADICVCAGSN